MATLSAEFATAAVSCSGCSASAGRPAQLLVNCCNNAYTVYMLGVVSARGKMSSPHSDLSVASATLPDVKSSSHCRWTSKMWGALPDSHP